MKLFSFSVASILALNTQRQAWAYTYPYTEADIVEVNLPNSWKPGGSGKSERIDGYSPPLSDGPYPVYVWLPGTGGSHWSVDDKLFAMDMAGRGYLAVSVDYRNKNYPLNCQGFLDRARDIFDDTDVSSAMSAVCAKSYADCSTIVVSGFSQGANLASLAHSYTANVQAAYLIGNVEPTVTDCYDIADLALDKTRIRSVMGETDGYCDGNLAGVQICLETT